MAITTPVPIPAGPPVPNSNDPETTFDAQFEQSLTWQRNELAPKANDLATATFANAMEAQASATASASSAAASEASSLASAGSSNFKGDWSALTGPLNRPASVAHAGRTWLLLQDLANVASATPADGSAYWRAYDILLPVVHVIGATQTAVASHYYSLENAAAITLTLPASPADGALVSGYTTNGRYDNVVARNGSTIMGLAEDMVLDIPGPFEFRYINGSWRLQ